jgi:DoxX-like family
MNKLIWTLQAVTALAFAGAGGMKLATPTEQLRANPQMAWSKDYSDGSIKAIGAAEVLGAIGLIVPAATGIVPALTPAAGAGLAALMGGAAYTHVQRDEPPIPPVILGALALTSGLLRWRRRQQTATARAPQ